MSGVEAVVPLKELIDVDAELDKLAREHKALEQDLQRVRGKLGNENFLRNAPPDVVAKKQAGEAAVAEKVTYLRKSGHSLFPKRPF